MHAVKKRVHVRARVILAGKEVAGSLFLIRETTDTSQWQKRKKIFRKVGNKILLYFIKSSFKRNNLVMKSKRRTFIA